MLLRLFVGAAIVVAFAVLAPAVQNQPAVQASPVNEITNVQFAYQVTPEGQIVTRPNADYFSRDTRIVWAVVDFRNYSPGTKLTYILRLNGWDYTYGGFGCCDNVTSGRLAFPLHHRDDPGKEIPGGHYELFIYESGQQVGYGTFGVRGGHGSDNGNPESNTQRNDND